MHLNKLKLGMKYNYQINQPNWVSYHRNIKNKFKEKNNWHLIKQENNIKMK